MKKNSRPHLRAWAPALVLALAVTSLAAKPKKEKPPTPPPPGGALPADLNKASMRVIAVDTLYQLDLSPDQLNAMRSAATGAESDADRSEPKGNPKLTAALEDLNRALLEGSDDEQISKLRNELSDLSTGDDVHLDDEVRPTKVALTKAAALTRKLSASQIAAFLASHADEVAGPVEKMVAALPSLHDTGAAVDADTQDIADDVAHLAVGLDNPGAPALSAKVLAWLKSNRDLSDEDIVTRHDSLEASARKVVGDYGPIDVIGHWMENQTAILLSNPQLPEAISAMLAAKERQ